MEQYRKNAEKKWSKERKHHPAEADRVALVKGQFASRERTEFFEDAFGDIMVDLFYQWASTEFHETQRREWLYNTVQSLGSVKQRLIDYETYGKNIEFMHSQDKSEETNNG